MIEAYAPTVTPVLEAPEDTFTSAAGEKLSAQDTPQPEQTGTPEQETNTFTTIALFGAGTLLGTASAIEQVTAQAEEEARQRKQLQAVRLALAHETKKQAAKNSTTIKPPTKLEQQAA